MHIDLLDLSAAPRPRRSAALALCLALAGAATGCIHVYQPMSGLHRPVVVDPQLPNFQDVRLTVRCVPGDLLNPQDASALCQKVQMLFENQGALVTTTTTAHGAPDDDLEAEAPTPDDAEAPRTELTLELRARRVHQEKHPVSWVLCVASFTVLPGVTESTFAQDVVIRDGTGFLLLSDSLEGRIVDRFGLGPWAGNAFLDAVSRDEAEKLGGDAFDLDLSTDLYRQLSQMLFNAEMQWQILQQAPSGRAN